MQLLNMENNTLFRKYYKLKIKNFKVLNHRSTLMTCHKEVNVILLVDMTNKVTTLHIFLAVFLTVSVLITLNLLFALRN